MDIINHRKNNNHHYFIWPYQRQILDSTIDPKFYTILTCNWAHNPFWLAHKLL